MGSGDVIDVSVGDDDLLDGEVVFLEQSDDAGDVVAGIDDDGLAGGFVAEDGAVALEETDGEDFVDHVSKTNGRPRICADFTDLKAQKNGNEKSASLRPALFELQDVGYFFGVLCVVLVPERTE